MKLSENTISILKSFTSINPSIYINRGSKLRTISLRKDILAEAEVEDQFEKPFGIYDLNQFLSVLSLFDKPELEFSDSYLTISDKDSSVVYGYADAGIIVQPPEKKISLPDTVVEFELSNSVLKRTVNAASILQLPNWTVTGDEEKVSIVVGNEGNKSSNQFKNVVGKTDLKFNLIFKVENLKFIDDTYDVAISAAGISKFASKNGKIVYYVATESKNK
jgi:hypothetical protein